jgi:alkylation response protein AidB-like acyl-CoA dehydrogenase
MRFLQLERETLERYAPGLDGGLTRLGLTAAEKPASEAIPLFRGSAAAALLVPRELGGAGAPAVDALRFQIALGSRAPSLAVATTMHQYKVAALCRLRPHHALDGVLARIAAERCLVASGGSEGEPGRKLYQPSVTARDTPEGVTVQGTKKPCCLTWSMDLLTVMVRSAPESRYRGELLHVIVDAKHPSIRRERFWTNHLLAAAESDAVTLDQVPVPEEHVFKVGSAEAARPFALAAFAWFELLACGAYLGITSALVERLLATERGASALRAQISCELDTLTAALERAAERLDAGELTPDSLSRIFRIRYVVERSLPEVAARCFTALGGLAIIQFPEVAYLEPATRLLACHVPSFDNMADTLAGQLTGGPLILG